MAEDSPETAAKKNQIEPSKVPDLGSGILILPASNTDFYARWSLSHESRNNNLEATSLRERESRLALRVFYLPAGTGGDEYSKVWHDFSLSGVEGSGHFTLPKPAEKINAAIGLIDKSGHFTPLLRGKGVEMPDSPESKQKPTEELNDQELINLVHQNLVPNTFQPVMDSASGTAHQAPEAEGSDQSANSGGSSAQLDGEEGKPTPRNAPIEIRVVFMIRGRIASGMKLMLGNEIVEPDQKGFFLWKKELNSFTQVWPMLYAALLSPSVPAAPSLQFFKDVASSERLLEMEASLEIKGKVNDPAYLQRLPHGLEIDSDGQFKLSRMLPEGAVILPGLSLIAS